MERPALAPSEHNKGCPLHKRGQPLFAQAQKGSTKGDTHFSRSRADSQPRQAKHGESGSGQPAYRYLQPQHPEGSTENAQTPDSAVRALGVDGRDQSANVSRNLRISTVIQGVCGAEPTTAKPRFAAPRSTTSGCPLFFPTFHISPVDASDQESVTGKNGCPLSAFCLQWHNLTGKSEHRELLMQMRRGLPKHNAEPVIGE